MQLQLHGWRLWQQAAPWLQQQTNRARFLFLAAAQAFLQHTESKFSYRHDGHKQHYEESIVPKVDARVAAITGADYIVGMAKT